MKLWNPEDDGKTHINVYSKGKTDLGRFLSNFARSPCDTAHGIFDSIEGYWYWLGCGIEHLRHLSGFQAKEFGKAQPRTITLAEDQFQTYIKIAIYKKILMRNDIVLSLVSSSYPFAHYYVFDNGHVKDAGYYWIIEWIECCRRHLKLKYGR